LEAFSQFGSDLDAETRRTLARGERLVTTLNQRERHPMPVEQQVVQIFAATNGYLDRITVDRVGPFLDELTDYIGGNEPELLKQIAGGDWSDEVQSELDKAVSQFAQDFGYDLDEEGLPLDEEVQVERRGPSGNGARSPSEPGGDGGSGRDGSDEESGAESSAEQETEAQPA
jgi:F-type H+-transporting ATPase subunit alpha